MTTPQSRYYAKHREELLPKMREREKTRRVTRQSKYADDPSLHEEDKEKMRQKYYNRVQRTIQQTLTSAMEDPAIPDATKHMLLPMVGEKVSITPAALRKMISSAYTNQMPKKGEKKDAVVVPTTEDAPVATPAVEEKKDEKKARKPRAAKRVVSVMPGEEIVIKVEHGPIKVAFD
jgi:hypothetical protein